jgi:hypothetical protein
MRLEVAVSGRLDEAMLGKARILQQAVNRAVVRQTNETRGRLRAMVAGRLGGKAANTVYGQAGPDRRIGNEGQVVGVVSSRWWRKANGRRVNVLDGFETGLTIRPTQGRFLAIPLPAAGKSRRGGRITPQEWEERNNQDLILLQRPGKRALLMGRVSRLDRSGVGRTSIRRLKSGAVRTGKRLLLPMFVLVPQTRLPKRLDAASVRREADQRLAEKIVVEATVGGLW